MLTDLLIGYAAGDTIVIRVASSTHQVVVLILDRGGIDRHLGGKLLESLGETWAPEYSKVRLWAGAKVIERIEEAEARLRYLVTTIEETTTD